MNAELPNARFQMEHQPWRPGYAKRCPAWSISKNSHAHSRKIRPCDRIFCLGDRRIVFAVRAIQQRLADSASKRSEFQSYALVRLRFRPASHQFLSLYYDFESGKDSICLRLRSDIFNRKFDCTNCCRKHCYFATSARIREKISSRRTCFDLRAYNHGCQWTSSTNVCIFKQLHRSSGPAHVSSTRLITNVNAAFTTRR